MSWKVGVKGRLAAALERVGYTGRRLRAMGAGGAVLVLAYHRVLTPEEAAAEPIQPGMFVLDSTFRMQMEYLSRRCRPVSRVDLDGGLTAKRPGGRPGFLVTFDDGWSDNYRNAFPVLKRLEIPAIFFMPTAYIGSSRWFWSDKLAHLAGLLHGAISPSAAAELAGRLDAFDPDSGWSEFRSAAPGHRVDLLDRLTLRWKAMDREAREERLAAMADALNDLELPPWEREPRMMSWEEAAELNRQGMEIGSHTHNHEILTRLSLAEAEEEMVTSRKVIVDRLGVDVKAFAFPNGDANEDLTRLASRHFRCSFGVQQGAVYPGSDANQLARVMMHEDMSRTAPLFACRLAGIF